MQLQGLLHAAPPLNCLAVAVIMHPMLCVWCGNSHCAQVLHLCKLSSVSVQRSSVGESVQRCESVHLLCMWCAYGAVWRVQDGECWSAEVMFAAQYENEGVLYGSESMTVTI
jgi:hypothetical protein